MTYDMILPGLTTVPVKVYKVYETKEEAEKIMKYYNEKYDLPLKVYVEGSGKVLLRCHKIGDDRYLLLDSFRVLDVGIIKKKIEELDKVVEGIL